MQLAARPLNEFDRLQAVRSYDILHTPAESEFDEITRLAKQITGVPISLISIVDDSEVWFKSADGMNICSSDRLLSFCSHTITQPDHQLVIENTKEHPLFYDHPFVKDAKEPIMFYAGISLIDKNNFSLGTLCVIDNEPNSITQDQLNALKILANQVTRLIEYKKTNNRFKEAKRRLEEQNSELKNFAGVISHDMKMPLANMVVTTDVLRKKYEESLDDQGVRYLDYLKQSSFTLSKYITDILAHYESDNIAKDKSLISTFQFNHLLESLTDMLSIKDDCKFTIPEEDITIIGNQAALEQILLNLIGNSLKYNDKELIEICIDCNEDQYYYYISIKDNGIGIPEDKVDSIFDLFTTVAHEDRSGSRGNGIGLSTVKRLVDNLNGNIHVASKVGEGTTFNFTIKKAADS
ncbi:ATP-binding protein [Gangjinia marincola]|uniref:histidine kinase n=1 Tax=Gangjinia marincola TaxID=578463 RepID=A0ABN1ME02_9FLAO